MFLKYIVLYHICIWLYIKLRLSWAQQLDNICFSFHKLSFLCITTRPWFQNGVSRRGESRYFLTVNIILNHISYIIYHIPNIRTGARTTLLACVPQMLAGRSWAACACALCVLARTGACTTLGLCPWRHFDTSLQ